MFPANLTLRPECPHCHPTSTYCPECGEKRFSEKDFSFKNFFSGLIGDFTDFDSKLLKTLWLLTFRPGLLTSEHCRGVHVPYIKPLRLFVVIAVVHFLAFGLSQKADFYSMDNGIFSWAGVSDQIKNWPPLQAHIKSSFDIAQVNKSIKDNLSILIYLILLAAAGIYYALFREQRKYYSQHLVFFLHIVSAAFLRNFLLLPVLLIYQPLGIALAVILNLLYVFMAIQKFYSLSAVRTLLTIIPTVLLIAGMGTALWSLSVVIALWK